MFLGNTLVGLKFPLTCQRHFGPSPPEKKNNNNKWDSFFGGGALNGNLEKGLGNGWICNT